MRLLTPTVRGENLLSREAKRGNIIFSYTQLSTSSFNMRGVVVNVKMFC